MEDSAYLALADTCRRWVLYELLEGRTIDLSTVLADGGEADDDQRVALYHQHLPMLADAGYVRWDRANERVEQGERFDVVRPLVVFHVTESDPPPVTSDGGVPE